MHIIIKKIYYHDTDCGGVVYYANYLKYFEEARVEYMQMKGIDLKQLGEQGILFVVKNVEIEYKSPARYGDLLSIVSAVESLKNVTIDFYQEAKRSETTLVTAKTKLVCINSGFRPVAIPQEVFSCLNI